MPATDSGQAVGAPTSGINDMAQTATAISSASKFTIAEAVKIVAGAAKGQTGVVVFSGGGVAYVRVGAELVKVISRLPCTDGRQSAPSPSPR